MRKPCPLSARKHLATGIFTATLALTGTAQAQVLEEVVVTAQKRVENLQDVPISITALTGDKLDEAGITRIEDLQVFTPNLSLSETGISTQIYIRGIGTGNNQGFEQSVGQYVDGIYYGRQQLLRLPFLDLERIEVLRGPQSILFGKNSIAGALNMTTTKPILDEFEGSIAGNYSPDGDISEFTGIVNVPFTDNLAGRLAIRKYDEDGWLDNTFKDEDETDRDNLAVRGAIRWEITDDLTVDFKAEYNEFDATGRAIEIVQDDPSIGGPLPGLTYSQILGALGHPGAITEIDQDNDRQADTAEFSNNEVENYTLTVEYLLGDITMTSITGYVTYEFEETGDLDFVAAPIFEGLIDEEYEQFSQEIRFVSPGGETVDWIAGVFFQTNRLDFEDNIHVFQNSVLGSVSAALQPILGTNSQRNFSADSDLYAAFAQATWNINDAMRLTVGGRYTIEEKDATKEINIVDDTTGEIEAGLAPIIYQAVFAIDSQQTAGGHFLDDDRTENVFTPLVNFQWDVTDDVMLYASYSTGFKSGGFDARSNSNSPEGYEFEEEEATSYELGAKTTLFDGAAELNVALYRTEYDDLQVSQFDGTLGFTVGNAAETIVQGVEIDGRWALTDDLLMTYAVAYLDHEFDEFTNGNCYNRQVPDGDIVNGVQLCDYSGRSGQYTPEWTGNFGLNHSKDIGYDLELQTSFDISYKHGQNTHVNLDPQYNVSSHTVMNFRMGLYHENWDVALLVQNLNDQQLLTYVGNTPLSGSTFGTNTFYSFVSRPRTTYLQATYRF